MIFDWDEEKNQINRAKHGIWFEEAQTVFEDDYARVFYDDGYLETEDRFLLIGKSHFGNTLIVIHCYRQEDEVIRLISARKASKQERKFYEEGI